MYRTLIHPRRVRPAVLAALATVFLPRVALAWAFTDVTAAAGLSYDHGYVDSTANEPRTFSGGVAAGDYDRDGFIDLYAVRGDIGANLLFRNRGDGTFEEVGSAAGVASSGRQDNGPTFADIDGDGWLDLLVLGIGTTRLTLFRNRGDGTFADVTAGSGLDSVDRNSFSAAFGDYDGDGDLDLFLSHWLSPVNIGESTQHLWRNNGDFTFTDVTAAAGIVGFVGTSQFPDYDLSFTPNFADIDSDGWLDLLLASDFGTTKIFTNQRDGTFRDTTSAVLTDENGMGAAVGDYDNDGDLDWFVSSIWDPNGVAEDNWGISGNRLYRNRGDGSFDDATDSAGVRSGYWGWGSTFADLNNDGWLDLFHVNGTRGSNPNNTIEFDADPSRLFVNQGDGTFSEQSEALGLIDTGQGRGVVAFDYDRDGDLDLFIANNRQPARLLRNDGGNEKRFLTVKLLGRSPNSEGIGARVYVTSGQQRQMRELRAGSNFESQDPAEAHFGVGDRPHVDSVEVAWPDGSRVTLAQVDTNQRLMIVQPEPTASATPEPTASATPEAPSPTATPSLCNAACSMTEVLRSALTGAAPPDCSIADTDGNDLLTIEELVHWVSLDHGGCRAAGGRISIFNELRRRPLQ